MYTYRWDRISHASLTRNKNTYHLGIHFRYRYLGSIRHTFRDWDVAFFAPSVRTHREIFFEILLNKSEIRLYLQYSDWFGSKRTSVWIQINRKMVNTILFRVDLLRFRKKFSIILEQKSCGGKLKMPPSQQAADQKTAHATTIRRLWEIFQVWVYVMLLHFKLQTCFVLPGLISALMSPGNTKHVCNLRWKSITYIKTWKISHKHKW